MFVHTNICTDVSFLQTGKPLVASPAASAADSVQCEAVHLPQKYQKYSQFQQEKHGDIFGEPVNKRTCI